jgi:hypothetical protein
MPTVEQWLALEGDVRAGAVSKTAGDFNCSLPGCVHEDLVTDRGALLLLLVSPARYEPVDKRQQVRPTRFRPAAGCVL